MSLINVEGNVGIRLPSVPSQSVGEDQSGTGRDHSGSTVVAKKNVVTQLTGVERGAAAGAPALGKTANTAQVGCIPSESADAPASCLHR